MVKVEVTKYQRLLHRDCCEITLTNTQGAAVTILNYGATLEKFLVPAVGGVLTNMVMSLPTAADYSK